MITISPGHWRTGGAVDLLNEVTEARKIANKVVEILRASNIKVNHIEDNTSTNQQQNLTYLVNAHNKTSRKLDVSIHLNAASRSKDGRGVEVLYFDAKELAAKVSESIAVAGKFKNRGAKERKELAFLRGTNEKAILIEVLFVSDEYDAKMYRQRFETICQAIAKELASAVGKSLKQPVVDKANDKKEEKKLVKATEQNQLLNETGRSEIRKLLKKAREAGIIDASYHTDTKIIAYDDVQLLSYQAAIINREFK